MSPTTVNKKLTLPFAHEVEKSYNYKYFYPLEDADDCRTDTDDDHDLVADIDSDTLIRIVKILK